MLRKRPIPAVTAPVEDEPTPRPRFRLRHRVLAVLVAAAALVGVRLGWGWYAGRQLDAAVAELRAKGEPAVAEDFREPVMADRDNAVTLLRRAAAAMEFNEEEWGQLAQDKKLPESRPALVRDRWRLSRLLEVNRGALADVRGARALPGIRWDFSFRQAADTDARGLLSDQWVWGHKLNGLLICAFLHARASQDHAAAVEYLRDMLFLCRATGRQPSHEEYETPLRIGWDVAELAQSIAAELQIGGGVGAAGREQVAGLVWELADLDAEQENCVRAMHGRCVLIQERTKLYVAGESGRYDFVARDHATGTTHTRRYAPRPLQKAAAWLFAPYFRLRTADHLRQVAPAAGAAALPDLPSADAALGPRVVPNWVRARPPASAAAGGPRGMLGVHWAVTLYDFPPAEPLRRLIGLYFWNATTRRLAALALAARLYELDNPGRMPAKLEDLVPGYLPAVPLDPCMAGNRPLGYVFAPRGPFVYSVWLNGVDDYAAGRWGPPHDRNLRDRFGQADYYMPLSQPKHAPASGPGSTAPSSAGS